MAGGCHADQLHGQPRSNQRHAVARRSVVFQLDKADKVDLNGAGLMTNPWKDVEVMLN